MGDVNNQLGGAGGRRSDGTGGDGLGGKSPNSTPINTGGTGNPGNATTSGGWSPYGGGYTRGGGGYGRGGGGGNSGPSDLQRDTARNLQPIINYNYDTLGDKFDLGDRVYDEADLGSNALHDWQVAAAERNAGEDWYRQQQKLQSSMKNMRDEMGNAAYGSDFIDMYEGFARADDQMDDDTLQALRKNLEEIDANWFDALQNNVNSRNKLAADTQIAMRELAADWAAQLNNIHPEIATEGIVDGDKEKTLKEAYEDSYDKLKEYFGVEDRKEEDSIRGLDALISPDKDLDEQLEALRPSELAELARSGDLNALLGEERAKEISESEPTKYEVPALINREDSTLDLPDWFDTDFARQNWTTHIRPNQRGFIRPDGAAAALSNPNHRTRNNTTGTSSAAVNKAHGIASYLQPYSANSGNRRTQ